MRVSGLPLTAVWISPIALALLLLAGFGLAGRGCDPTPQRDSAGQPHASKRRRPWLGWLRACGWADRVGGGWGSRFVCTTVAQVLYFRSAVAWHARDGHVVSRPSPPHPLPSPPHPTPPLPTPPHPAPPHPSPPHAQTRSHTRTRRQTYSKIRSYTHAHTQTSTLPRTRSLTHAHARSLTHTHTHTHTHKHTLMKPSTQATHTSTHTHTRTQTHTHKHACSL